jgi:hypothetical protein
MLIGTSIWSAVVGVGRVVAAAAGFDNGLFGEWAVDMGFTLNHVGGAEDLYIATEDLATDPGHVLENINVPMAGGADLVWTFKMRRKPTSLANRDLTFEQYNTATGGGLRMAGIISLTDSGQAWLAQDAGFVVGTITNTVIADGWHDVTITWHTPAPAVDKISFFMGTGFYGGDGVTGIEFKEMKVEIA